jgi:dTDP-4-amino-4,6-dideoxygalactose transaminase
MTSASKIGVGVPFVDLARSHGALRSELVGEFDRLVRSGAFVNGPDVAAFEEEFAGYCGTRFAVGLSSGLDALRLALLALGIGRGDEVIVPAQTFVATFEAVDQAGAIPVPVDIGFDDGIDPEAIRAALTSRTAAIMPVHLYGQLADLVKVRAVAAAAGLAVIEDACQAHGAMRDGIGAGTGGVAGAFSFYPAKNLGAFGDAGALVTDDPEIARRVRAMREHGQSEKYHHEMSGYTARLDTLQAAVLRHKLPLLAGWNLERSHIAGLYADYLSGLGDPRLPVVAENSRPAWHLYVIRTRERDALRATLTGRGIGTGIHYPIPPYLTEAYSHLGFPRGSFPCAEALAEECLSLPIFPGMRDDEAEQVIQAVSAHFA